MKTVEKLCSGLHPDFRLVKEREEKEETLEWCFQRLYAFVFVFLFAFVFLLVFVIVYLCICFILNVAACMNIEHMLSSNPLYSVWLKCYLVKYFVI